MKAEMLITLFTHGQSKDFFMIDMLLSRKKWLFLRSTGKGVLPDVKREENYSE